MEMKATKEHYTDSKKINTPSFAVYVRLLNLLLFHQLVSLCLYLPSLFGIYTFSSTLLHFFASLWMFTSF